MGSGTCSCPLRQVGGGSWSTCWVAAVAFFVLKSSSSGGRAWQWRWRCYGIGGVYTLRHASGPFPSSLCSPGYEDPTQWERIQAEVSQVSGRLLSWCVGSLLAHSSAEKTECGSLSWWCCLYGYSIESPWSWWHPGILLSPHVLECVRVACSHTLWGFSCVLWWGLGIFPGETPCAISAPISKLTEIFL